MQRVMSGLDFEMPACVGPVSYRDLDAVRADIANEVSSSLHPRLIQVVSSRRRLVE